MKTLILICILLIPLRLNAQKWTSEEKAIVKVHKAEGEAFAAFDKDRLFNLHVQDKTAARLAGINNLIQGWDEIKLLLEGYMERNKANPIKNPKNLKENILIKVTGNSAWLVCDNIWKWEEFEGEELESLGFENKQIAFFEKIDGKWKFSFNAFIAKPEPEKENEN